MVATALHTPSFIAALVRAYDRALRTEENATTMPQAWRAARASERALRDLEAARNGLPLPARPAPRTLRQRGKDGLAALAQVGRAIAKAMQVQAALRKAHAATALLRAAKAARKALRNVVGAIALLAVKLTAKAQPERVGVNDPNRVPSDACSYWQRQAQRAMGAEADRAYGFEPPCDPDQEADQLKREHLEDVADPECGVCTCCEFWRTEEAAVHS